MPPGSACQTCKTRRIKCDERKPICQRCEKSRRACVEAQSVKRASFPIHVENRYASGETKRPRGPRPSSSLTTTLVATTTSVSPETPSSGAVPPPLQDEGQDLLLNKAMTYYLQHHLELTDDDPKDMTCVTGCLYAWRQSGRTCAMVNLALSSLALAVYSRTYKHAAAAVAASATYDQLLPIVRALLSRVENPDNTIATLDQTYIEGCLLTVMLMGQYDATMHCPFTEGLPPRAAFVSLTSWWHHDGAVALLKVWLDVLSPHNTPSCIITHARRGYIRSALLRAIPLPKWMSDGARFGEQGLELDYDRIVVRIVCLRHALIELQKRPEATASPREIDSLNRQAQDLDTALRDWAIKIPVTHSLTRHTMSPSPDGGAAAWPQGHFYSSRVYAYERPAYAALWAQYYSARMLVNSSRRRILKLLVVPSCPLIGSEYEQQCQDAVVALQAMADSLACALPSVLGHFGSVHTESECAARCVSIAGHSVSSTSDDGPEIKPHLASAAVWPLMIACSVRGIDEKQQAWFRAELAYIGRVTGNGMLQCADTDQWMEM